MNWSIQWMKCNPQVGSYTNYVVQVGWICVGQDSGNTASTYGTSSFKADPAQPGFTPYNNLSQSQVLQWVFNDPASPNLKSETEAVVAQQLAALKKPTMVDKPLPWSGA